MSLDVSLYYEKEGYENETVFHANITHNLSGMANVAGIYYCLWRPEEINAIHASDIIDKVEKGLIDMTLNPEKYKPHESDNGWGLYKHFLPWVAEYLEACRKFPGAKIHVSR